MHLVACGDFSGSGAAVLRGALARVSSSLAPVTLDASAVTALSADAAAALAEHIADQARPLMVVAMPDTLAALIGRPAPATRRRAA